MPWCGPLPEVQASGHKGHKSFGQADEITLTKCNFFIQHFSLSLSFTLPSFTSILSILSLLQPSAVLQCIYWCWSTLAIPTLSIVIHYRPIKRARVLELCHDKNQGDQTTFVVSLGESDIFASLNPLNQSLSCSKTKSDKHQLEKVVCFGKMYFDTFSSNDILFYTQTKLDLPFGLYNIAFFSLQPKKVVDQMFASWHERGWGPVRSGPSCSSIWHEHRGLWWYEIPFFQGVTASPVNCTAVFIAQKCTHF